MRLAVDQDSACHQNLVTAPDDPGGGLAGRLHALVRRLALGAASGLWLASVAAAQVPIPGDRPAYAPLELPPLETGDAGRLVRGAHTLRSAAGLLGASALVEAAFEMESLGRDERLADAGMRLEALETETARLLAALAKSGRA